jgi:hypothetical protein
MTVDDKDEIRELHARYNHLIDSFQAEAFSSLFTSDGVWELLGVRTVRGKDELVAFVHGLEADSGTRVRRHCVFNEVIDVDGDRAKAQSYVTAWLGVPRELPQLFALGLYDDTLRREGGRWLFEHRRLDCDWLVSRDV